MSNTPATNLSLSSFFQDQIILAGLPSPGYAEIVGAGSPRDWDIRKGYGYSGAFLVYTGDNLAKFPVKLHCWAPPDLYAEWKPFSKLLAKPPTGLTPTQLQTFALGVSHPLLNAEPINIKSLVVEDASQWDQDEFGEWVMTIKFIHFRAPVAALGKPDKTIPSIQGQNGESAAGTQGGGDPADLAIANLASQVFSQGSP